MGGSLGEQRVERSVCGSFGRRLRITGEQPRCGESSQVQDRISDTDDAMGGVVLCDPGSAGHHANRQVLQREVAGGTGGGNPAAQARIMRDVNCRHWRGHGLSAWNRLVRPLQQSA